MRRFCYVTDCEPDAVAEINVARSHDPGWETVPACAVHVDPDAPRIASQLLSIDEVRASRRRQMERPLRQHGDHQCRDPLSCGFYVHD
jgi:hypothetical protein